MNNKNNISIIKLLIVLVFFTITIPLSAQGPTVGLIYNDLTKSHPGYTLFGPKNTTTTYLIDNDGLLIHRWMSDYNPAATAYLLEDGNLLRATKLVDPNGGSGGFQVLDWDSNVIWGYTYGAQHHDINPLPNGNVLLVTNDIIANADVIAAGRDPNVLDGDIRSLKIIEIERDNDGGKIVWEWYAWDHLIQEFDDTKDNFGVVAEHPELIDLNFTKDGGSDWLHVNSIDYNQDFDQIMVSCRGVNELWIIDHSTTSGDLLYRWGNPIAYQAGTVDDQMLFAQHDARWVEGGLPGEGNIMAFNNGLDRPDGAYSSIIEITPPVDNFGIYTITEGAAFAPSTLSWLYTATVPTDMYSSKFSGAQRLLNGNTLICNGVGGELIEVTDLGEIVWRYINPESTDGILSQGDIPTKNDVFRSHRYNIDYLEDTGYDLTPGQPIELYTDTDGDGITDGYDNCPDTINLGQEDDDNDGIGNECDPYPLETEDSEGIVAVFKLEKNYPNPFNPITSIEFNLIEDSFITLTIYDLVGNKVRTLINDHRGHGFHSLTWDAHDDNGNPVSSGVYLYSINTGQQIQTKKMMLLR